MKRTLILIALALAITTSIIAGTLAMYTITIGDLAEGSVVAKEFILLEGETNTFEENVKIAPGEKVNWDFSVKNYDGEIISETGMDLEFNVEMTEADGKDAIDPLVVTVTDENGDPIVGTATDDGIKFEDAFPLDDVGQEKIFTVSVEWPWETDGIDDIEFAGADYGSAVKVSVTGTQTQE